MKEQLITFETAKLAKEKGFNIPTIYGCNEKGELQEYFTYNSYAPGEPEIRIEDFLRKWDYQLPTQSLLQKWLREAHGIHIQVYTIERWLESGNDMETYFEVNLKTTHRLNGLSNIKFNMLTFKTYEEALEIGLQEALKLIQS